MKKLSLVSAVASALFLGACGGGGGGCSGEAASELAQPRRATPSPTRSRERHRPHDCNKSGGERSAPMRLAFKRPHPSSLLVLAMLTLLAVVLCAAAKLGMNAQIGAAPNRSPRDRKD